MKIFLFFPIFIFSLHFLIANTASSNSTNTSDLNSTNTTNATNSTNANNSSNSSSTPVLNSTTIAQMQTINPVTQCILVGTPSTQNDCNVRSSLNASFPGSSDTEAFYCCYATWNSVNTTSGVTSTYRQCIPWLSSPSNFVSYYSLQLAIANLTNIYVTCDTVFFKNLNFPLIFLVLVIFILV